MTKGSQIRASRNGRKSCACYYWATWARIQNATEINGILNYNNTIANTMHMLWQSQKGRLHSRPNCIQAQWRAHIICFILGSAKSTHFIPGSMKSTAGSSASADQKDNCIFRLHEEHLLYFVFQAWQRAHILFQAQWRAEQGQAQALGQKGYCISRLDEKHTLWLCKSQASL